MDSLVTRSHFHFLYTSQNPSLDVGQGQWSQGLGGFCSPNNFQEILLSFLANYFYIIKYCHLYYQIVNPRPPQILELLPSPLGHMLHGPCMVVTNHFLAFSHGWTKTEGQTPIVRHAHSTTPSPTRTLFITLGFLQ